MRVPASRVRSLAPSRCLLSRIRWRQTLSAMDVNHALGADSPRYVEIRSSPLRKASWTTSSAEALS